MMIAVIGSGAGILALPQVLADAEAVGREIGRRGHTLVCGGRGGVMEAACRGAREAGGHTIGVLPGPDRSEANPYVEFPIVTNLGSARNLIIVQTADAVIAVGHGGYGTLSEIAMALVHHKPVVGLGTWRLSDDAGLQDQSIVRAQDPAGAVEAAIAAAERVRA
ncbi:MAG: TIGR00725 family protein [Dehalococcoidia bacterium]